jgi:membrane-associated phospholipid phosphatase
MADYYQRLVAPIGAGLLILGLLVIVAWWSARRQPEHIAAVIWSVIGALAALGLSQALAKLLAQPRPYDVLKQVEVLVPREVGYGLPSAHAALAGAVVCGLLIARRWRLAFFALVASLLLIFAGVYVGADYPGAVVAGALLGAALVLVLWPLASWVLAAVVNRVGASPVGGVVAIRGSLKKSTPQWALERPSNRLPDARAIDALRAASERAPNTTCKPGAGNGS